MQESSQLQGLLRLGGSDPWVMASAFGVAFFLGAAHALTPGHGKAVVAAYLVGSRGTVWDAVYLGGIVTLTHTASVFVLGVATLYASQQIAVDRILPWITLLSGTLIAAVGGWLLWARLTGRGHHHHHGHGHHHHHHGHDHGHHHLHEHHEHHEHGAHTHSHGHDYHDHHHSHAGHPHSHSQPHVHAHAHSAGSGAAVQAVKAAEPSVQVEPQQKKAGMGSLLSLGISGGMVPCPEALVVLLISISMHKLVFGLSLLVAFSLGLAAVLMGIGVAMVLAAPVMARFTGEGPWIKRLPVISAAVVAVLGVAIMVQALGQI